MRKKYYKREAKKAMTIALTTVVLICSGIPVGANVSSAGIKTIPVMINANSTKKDNANAVQNEENIPYDSYKSKSEIALNVRKALVDREEKIEMRVKTDGFENADELITEIFSVAWEETDKGYEGDYLHRSIISYETNEKESEIYQIGNATYYKIVMTVEYYTNLQQENELTKEIEKLINSFGFTDSTSDFDKIKTIYDYVCNNVKYDYDTVNDAAYKLKFSAYSALINKKAVCQGYATLMYRLLRECGVSTRYIHGTSNGGTHAWNIVKIGEYYYNVDATWDSEYKQKLNTYKYFLKSESGFKNHMRDPQDICDSAEFKRKYVMAPKSYFDDDEEDTTRTITKDNNGAEKNVKVKVTKAKIKSVQGKKISIKKQKYASGYQVLYSSKKNMKSAKKITKKSNVIKISKLKKKHRYYIKARAYQKIKGKKYYGKWSKIKKIIVK